MKAILFHEHGGPEVLKYEEFPAPEPGPGQVQINLKAAALNRLDLFVRNGWPGIKLDYPHIPGADGAGVVSALGDGVTDVAVGDRVVIDGTMSCGQCEYCLSGRDNLCPQGGILGEDMRGTYAEYVVVPARNVMKLPDTLAFEDAAAASLVFLTAWHSLITRGNVRPGETVLIVGASGGVNTASIQIAKLAGATVYVVGSDAHKLEQAQALGADVLVNRSEEDWGKAVFKLTGRRGVDVVVDNVGQATWVTSLRALRSGGRMLVVGGSSGYDVQGGLNYIFRRHISILGSTMAPRRDFRTVMGLIFEGRLKPVVGKVLPLEQAADAQRLLETGDVFGKIVLAI